MQTSYRYLCNDISKQINSNFPDANITFNQIVYWCRVAENFIRQRTLKVEITGSYLAEFATVNIQTDGIRKWIVLPSQVLDLSNDKGIDYILYQQDGIPYGKQIRFQQTTADVIDKLYWNPYEKPSPSNPYFYRVNQNIYLSGIESIFIPYVQIGLFTAVDTRPNILPIDSFIQINEEQVPSLKEIVIGYAKLSLIVPKDREETGDDTRNDNIATFGNAVKQTEKQES